MPERHNRPVSASFSRGLGPQCPSKTGEVVIAVPDGVILDLQRIDGGDVEVFVMSESSKG